MHRFEIFHRKKCKCKILNNLVNAIAINLIENRFEMLGKKLIFILTRIN